MKTFFAYSIALVVTIMLVVITDKFVKPFYYNTFLKELVIETIKEVNNGKH